MNALRPPSRAAESPAVHVALKGLIVAFGVVTSVLLALILAQTSRGVTIAEAARHDNGAQDQKIVALQQNALAQSHRLDAQQQISATTVANLQSLTIQITKLQDSLAHVVEIQQHELQSAGSAR